MRTRAKFLKELLGYSLKDIRRLEVQFDPFHPNAASIREFWFGITDRKALKTNPQVVTKTKIVCDRSNPLVTVYFNDSHKLVLDGKYLESGHLLQLIRDFGASHNESKDV